MANIDNMNNNTGPDVQNPGGSGTINNPGTDNVGGVTVDPNSGTDITNPTNGGTTNNGNGTSNGGSSNPNLKRDTKYLGESELMKEPTKKLTLQLKDGSVTTSKIADYAVTMKKTLGIQSYIDNKAKLLQTQIGIINNTLSSIGQGTPYDLTSQGGIIRLLMFIDDGQPYPAVVGSIPNGAIWFSPGDGIYHVWHDTTPEGEIEQTGTWEEWIPTGKEIFFDLTTNKLKRYDIETYTLVELVSSDSENFRFLVPKAFVNSTPFVYPTSIDPNYNQEQAWNEMGYELGDIIVDNSSKTAKRLSTGTTMGIQFVPWDVPEDDWKFVWNPTLESVGICVNRGTNKGYIAYLTDDDAVYASTVQRVDIEAYSKASGGINTTNRHTEGIYVSTVNNDEEETRSEAGLIPCATVIQPGVMSHEDKVNLDNLVNLYNDGQFATKEDLDINTGEFNPSSDKTASQKSITEFVAKVITMNGGKIFMPDYCCSKSELPTNIDSAKTWFDTDNNYLYAIDNVATNKKWYLSDGDAILMYVKKTISGVTTHDVILYVQTAGDSITYSLTSEKGNSSTVVGNNIMGVYSVTIWNDSGPQEGVTYPKGSTWYVPAGSVNNSDKERNLYVYTGEGTWSKVNEGTYLLLKEGASVEYYIYVAHNKILKSLNVDSLLNPSSNNAIQNKAVFELNTVLDSWKGKIIPVDVWDSTEPTSYEYWFNPVSCTLKYKSTEGVKTIIGPRILMHPNGYEFYLKNDTTLIHIVDEDLLNTKVDENYVWDTVDSITGKIIAVRLWSTNYESITDWKEGQYFFNQSTNKLYCRNNGGWNEIGKDGGYYILNNPNSSRIYWPWLWKRNKAPVYLYTNSNFNPSNYVTNNTFNNWKGRIIYADQVGSSFIGNPNVGSLWLDTDSITLKECFLNGSEEDWDTILTLDPDSAYLVWDERSGILHLLCSTAGVHYKYREDSVQEITVNGLPVTNEVNGKKVANINIDSSLVDVSINKGEVISPYWGELPSGQEFNQGDYWLTSNNILKKYVYNELNDENEWQQVAFGSYLLKRVVTDSQTNIDNEYLYFYTLTVDSEDQQEPVQLATHAEIASASGAVTQIEKFNGEPLPKSATGVVQLENYVLGSQLDNYATVSNLGTVSSNVSAINNTIKYQGKAVLVSDGGEVNTLGRTYTYDVNDTLELVIPTSGTYEGALLLKVVHTNNGVQSTTYYSSWKACGYLLGSSSYNPIENPANLYYSPSTDGYTFWMYDDVTHKLVPVVDVSGTFNDRITSLESRLEVIELSGYSTSGEPTVRTEDIGKYYIVPGSNSGQYQLKVCLGNNHLEPVTSDKLYILYYNGRLYAYKTPNLIYFPTNSDFNDFTNSIHECILIPKYWGSDSSSYLSWRNGDIWYDSNHNLIQVKDSSLSGFTEYSTSESAVLLFKASENKLYRYKNGVLTPLSTGSPSGSSSTQDTVVLIKYWQNEAPSSTPTSGEYWYDANSGNSAEKLWKYGDGGNSTAVALSESTIYVDCTSNIVYRWDGTEMVALSSGTISDEDLNNVLYNLALVLDAQSVKLAELQENLDYMSLSTTKTTVERLNRSIFGYEDLTNLDASPWDGEIGDTILVNNNYYECFRSATYPIISIRVYNKTQSVSNIVIPLVEKQDGTVETITGINFQGRGNARLDAEDICNQIAAKGYTRLNIPYNEASPVALVGHRGSVAIYVSSGNYYVVIAPKSYGNLARNDSHTQYGSATTYFYKGDDSVYYMPSTASTDAYQVLSYTAGDSSTPRYSKVGAVAAYSPITVSNTSGLVSLYSIGDIPSDPIVGQCFYSTTNKKPYWWDGEAWKDATGTPLS